MGRARRARKIAAAAAYGGGLGAAGVGAAGLVGYLVLKAETVLARRIVGQPFEEHPDDTDVYGHGPGHSIRIVVLGDSLAAGVGASSSTQTMGGIIATAVSAVAGRRVRLANVAQSGAQSSWLDDQVTRALEIFPEPDLAIISVGGNDVTHRINKVVAVQHLEEAVRRLVDSGAHVVVATCPDLGSVEPLAQPLRSLARRASRDLAAAQTVAVVASGGRTVSMGDLLGPEFISTPKVLFSEDRFHPSAAGYARVAAALLPSVCDALGLWATRPPDRLLGEGAAPLARAAARAVREPGTEVSATPSSGPGGLWGMRMHRRRPTPGVGESPDECD